MSRAKLPQKSLLGLFRIGTAKMRASSGPAAWLRVNAADLRSAATAVMQQHALSATQLDMAHLRGVVGRPEIRPTSCIFDKLVGSLLGPC